MQNKRIRFNPIVFLIPAALLSGCTTMPWRKNVEQLIPQATIIGPIVGQRVGYAVTSIFDSPNPCSNNDRNIGVVVGGVLGGLLGHLTHRPSSTGIGVALGAYGGALVGRLIDERRCELYKIALAQHLKMASALITPQKLGLPAASGLKPDTAIGLDVQIQNQRNEFVPGTALLTPYARAYLSQIARQFAPGVNEASLTRNATPQQAAQALNRVILIVGHTSDQDAGTTDLARLSQERAMAVAKLFAKNGVPADDIYYQGAGDALPIVPETASLRRENNRVQILDFPNLTTTKAYLRRRTAITAYYAATTHEAGSNLALRSRASRPPQTTIRHPVQTPGTSLSVAAVRTKPVPTPLHAVSFQQAASGQQGHGPPVYAETKFGGVPIQGDGLPVDLGPAPPSNSMFGLIAQAQASSLVIAPPCLADHPRVMTSVRNLATERTLPPRDYVPGFYDTVWVSYIRKNLVAMVGTSVFKGAESSAPSPRLLIYEDYSGNRNQRPGYNAKVPVNIYRGENKLLYRIFGRGPVSCIDLVVHIGDFSGKSFLYYHFGYRVFLAKPRFSVVR